MSMVTASQKHPGERKGVLRGDFGTSIVTRGKPVLEIIWERVPNTLLLMIPAQIIILVFGLIVGHLFRIAPIFLGGQHHYHAIIYRLFNANFLDCLIKHLFICGLISTLGAAHLPATGMFNPQVGKTAGQVAKHMILPLFSIAFIDVARYSRYIRSAMLEVMSQDYIRTAKPKD
jgi:peptide/nickel transport system permease protein